MQDINLESLARSYTTASVAALGAWATAKADGSENAVDPDIKIRAIGMLLDRGWGRPASTTKVTGADGLSPIIVEIVMKQRTEKK